MSFLRLILLSSVVVALAGAEWSQWRGPKRDGISTETNLLSKWPAGGPAQMFKAVGLGAGYASFSASGGKLFTQGQRGGAQYVIALDAKTGTKVWEVQHGDTYSNNRGDGPRGTPTVDGDRLYALGADGNLIALDLASGKTLWEVNLLQRFGAGNIKWGLSESPLIDGEKLIVNAGGLDASVVALDKNSGKTLWKSQSDAAGYSSAVVSQAGDVRQYAVLTGEAAIGLRASNGELLWRYSQVSNRTANIATPLVRGDYIFFSSDYGTGGVLLKLTPSGGGINAEEVYFTRDMRNHYSSSVLIGDHLYGFSSRILTCMNFLTGEVAWQDRSVGKGQIIAADGLLYILSEDGIVGLVEPSPAGYKEISRFEIGREDFPTWTLPVISDGMLYLRDQDSLFAYNIRP